MKKTLLALGLAAAAITPAAAQKANIYASYGGITQMDCVDNHDGWGSVHTAWGAVNAGLYFRVAPKFSIGPSYTFSSTSTDGGSNASHIAYHAVLFNGKFDYYRRGNLTLYAHAGVGVEISYLQPKFADNYTKAYFAGQISPLGLNVRISRGFNFFGEVGFGAQGVVQLGFSADL